MGLEPHLLMTLSEKGFYDWACPGRGYHHLYRVWLVQLCVPSHKGLYSIISDLERKCRKEIRTC